MKTVAFITLVWFVFLFNQIAYSQETNSVPVETEPFFWAVIVSDMNSSVDWYKKNLGLSVRYLNNYEERGFKQAALERPGLLLELIEMDSAIMPDEVNNADGKKARIGGFFKIGLQVDDFDKWYAWASQSNIVFHGSVVTDPVSKKRTVIILDPDRNRVQVFEK